MFNYKDYAYGRIGEISSPHGIIETPAFIFCATAGTIKTLPTINLASTTQILLCNTFHLANQANLIHSLGGLHKFISWNKPIITDSGGFQIFSLGYGGVVDEIKGCNRKNIGKVKIKMEGCYFKDPNNGSERFLSPTLSAEIQYKLGVDFAVSFDECTASHVGYQYTEKSTKLSQDWSLASLNHYLQLNPEGKMYGVMQGGIYKNLREASANFLNNNNFFGSCIGGSLGQSTEEMYQIVKFSSSLLNKTRPIHLLGIGRVKDIINLAHCIDSFDCVEPTRIARHGVAFVEIPNKINLNRSNFAKDPNPILMGCKCSSCQNFSRAYIHYLLKNKELVAGQIISQHNIHYMNELMIKIRSIIKSNQNPTILLNN